MNGKVLTLVPAAKPASVAAVLDEAMQADLTDIVVVGFCRDGREYFRSNGSSERAAWLLQRGAWWLMTSADDAGEPA